MFTLSFIVNLPEEILVYYSPVIFHLIKNL
jgi:hypothetical protein